MFKKDLLRQLSLGLVVVIFGFFGSCTEDDSIEPTDDLTSIIPQDVPDEDDREQSSGRTQKVLSGEQPVNIDGVVEVVENPETARDDMSASEQETLDLILGLSDDTGSRKLADISQPKGWLLKGKNGESIQTNEAFVFYFFEDGFYDVYDIAQDKWFWGTWYVSKNMKFLVFDIGSTDFQKSWRIIIANQLRLVVTEGKNAFNYGLYDPKQGDLEGESEPVDTTDASIDSVFNIVDSIEVLPTNNYFSTNQVIITTENGYLLRYGSYEGNIGEFMFLLTDGVVHDGTVESINELNTGIGIHILTPDSMMVTEGNYTFDSTSNAPFTIKGGAARVNGISDDEDIVGGTLNVIINDGEYILDYSGTTVAGVEFIGHFEGTMTTYEGEWEDDEEDTTAYQGNPENSFIVDGIEYSTPIAIFPYFSQDPVKNNGLGIFELTLTDGFYDDGIDSLYDYGDIIILQFLADDTTNLTPGTYQFGTDSTSFTFDVYFEINGLEGVFAEGGTVDVVDRGAGDLEFFYDISLDNGMNILGHYHEQMYTPDRTGTGATIGGNGFIYMSNPHPTPNAIGSIGYMNTFGLYEIELLLIDGTYDVGNDSLYDHNMGVSFVFGSDQELQISEGIYSFSQDIAPHQNEFLPAALEMGGSKIDVIGGFVNIMMNGSDYDITYDITLNGGEEISGQYFGNIEYVDRRDIDPPSIPVNLTLIDTTDMSITFSWDPSTDAAPFIEYEIYIDGTPSKVVQGTEATLYGLSPDNQYDLTVAAIDPFFNNSGESIQLGVTTSMFSDPDFDPPTEPNSIDFMELPDKIVHVFWEASTDNTGIGEYELMLDGNPIGATTETDFFLYDLPIGSYEIQIIARDYNGNQTQAIFHTIDIMGQ